MTGDTLRTDRFLAAWAEWVEYRREARKPLAAATVGKQIRELEAYGHDHAIASIENSIRNGWAGLFKPDGGNGRAQAENRARVRRDDDPYSARSRFFDNSPPTAAGGRIGAVVAAEGA